jgi:hypothetical protein
MRALTDSMALVVQTILRISASNCRKGDELGPGVLPEPDDRRILLPPFLAELEEPADGGVFGRGRVRA